MAASKLNQVLEAKWQEFQDSNPYNQTEEVQEVVGDSSDEGMDDSKPVSVAGNSKRI